MAVVTLCRIKNAFVSHASLHARLASRPYRSLRSRSGPNRGLVVASASSRSKKRIVFLGTPQVAANTLQTLYNASQSSASDFAIKAVVTQPPAPVGRKKILTKSPVHQLAEELNIDPILTPSRARDSDFLRALEDLEPDLCITAAYGQFLPTRFLIAPRCGTLNIHPSLLPLFRGAAPVPRALQEGVSETGVCVLYTVLKMDAGPIIARRVYPLSGDEQAPELLQTLFHMGTEALLEVLPSVWNDSAPLEPQNDDFASHAPKISKEEGRLTFTENARIVHNKVRAFAGWPGTWGDFTLTNERKSEDIQLKIGKTKVLREEGGMCVGIHDVNFDETENCLSITCGDGSRIGALTVLPAGKKEMDARSFWNGLRGKAVQRKHLPY